MATPPDLKTVAVLGNGIIGHGVAQIFAVAGKDVRLIGRRQESLDAWMGRVRESLDAFERHGLISADEVAAACARIKTTTNLADAEGCELVVEAVPEDTALKVDLFGQLDRICAPPAVFASSSGQPISNLVGKMVHRGRAVAAHFWNPSQLIPLVEVCAGPETDPDVVPWLCEQLRAVGKEPAVLDREIPGFIGNRLQFALLREAWHLWSTGVASAEAIDSAVKHSFGRRLAVTGPLESADVGGVDTMVTFSSFLFPSLAASHEAPAAIAEVVAQGHRGLSTGRGVYDWTKRDGRALVERRTEELFRQLQADRS
jgi:3-hydroxybutyryl-CoA dehydrogenase